MRICILVVACGLLLSACVAQPASPDAIYGAHSYVCCVEDTTILSWHAGQHLTLHWQPTPPTRTTDPSPHQIVLSLTLTGPFPNVDALKQATGQGVRPAGTTTITAAPVTVNDRNVVAPSSDLNLPLDLPPGFYNLETQAVSGGSSAGGGTVVHVIPP